MSTSPSVAVVGGGAIGLATAYELVRQGADVTVLEARQVGSGASWGNAGWIVPSLAGPVPAKGQIRYTLRSLRDPDSPVYLAPRLDPDLVRWAWGFWRRCNDRDHYDGLHATARLGAGSHDLYDRLRADGVDFEMWTDGLLFVSLQRAGAESELEYLRVLEPYGYKLPDTVLEGDDLHAIEPFLSPDVAAGFIIGEERHVQPASLTTGLAEAIRRLGGTVVEGAEVTAIDRVGRHVTAVRTTAGVFRPDQVLLAAGAWTTPLARHIGVNVPVLAGKGYSFSLEVDQPPARPVYLGDVKVGVTPFGHQVRFAGTMEISGINLDLDRRRVKAIVNGARRFVRHWPEQPLREVWAGMRPMAPDGLPIMGRAPGLDNTFVSTGHAMLGITLAPASGVAMAELMLSGRTPEVLEPFGLERFGR
ncbi:MAG TPA: FAD-dependent oxidoreductase [Nitriliruptorales bacterium]